jgi:hypothetical protein
MRTLKNGSSVDADASQKVLKKLRALQREKPRAFLTLVDKAKNQGFRFSENDEAGKILQEAGLLSDDRTIIDLVAAVLASALEERNDRFVIVSPFVYEDA